MDYYCLSEIGNREVNEDNVGAYIGSEVSVFIVADGLGGHSNGEVASKIAVDTARELIMNSISPNDFFDCYFDECECRLVQKQNDENNPSGIKTTVVVGVLSNTRMNIAHVGDSRLYHFRNNKVQMRTLDHSVPQMMVLAGDIPDKKIRNHPDRNRLLKVMGERSLFESSKEIYDCEEVSVISGDAFLLCTDGFWELITEHDMEKALKRSKTSEEWCRTMTEIIRKNGRKKEMDNYSAICVMV